MTLKGLDTPASPGAGGANRSRRRKFPHLDRLVQAATDELLATGGEGNGVNAILVAIGTLQALQEVPLVDIPNAYALVQGASCYVFCIRGNSNSSDAIFYGER